MNDRSILPNSATVCFVRIFFIARSARLRELDLPVFSSFSLSVLKFSSSPFSWLSVPRLDLFQLYHGGFEYGIFEDFGSGSHSTNGVRTVSNDSLKVRAGRRSCNVIFVALLLPSPAGQFFTDVVHSLVFSWLECVCIIAIEIKDW